MIAFEGVTATRGGRRVLADIDLTIAPARVTVVVGANGAGKSTLLAIAAGLLAPAAGRVLLDGEPLAAIDRRTLARRRAYLPQSPAVDWPISVERVVALGLSPYLPTFGALPRRWEGAIDAALARFDLVGLRHRPATELSGGELARAMLARATVGAPDVLIADEPTAGLDPRHARDAARHLRALADEGCAVLVALHDLDLALALADDAVALADSRVVAAGPIDAVFVPAVLERLYGLPTRIVRDDTGASVRFLG